MTVKEAKKQKRLSIEDLRSLETDILTPVLAAKFLGVNPYSINVAARINPDGLGYPLSLQGSRVIIPKAGFLRWAEGQAQP